MQHASQFYSKGIKSGSRRAKISFRDSPSEKHQVLGTRQRRTRMSLSVGKQSWRKWRITVWNRERAKQCVWNKTPILAAAVRATSLWERVERFVGKCLWESIYPVGYSKYYSNEPSNTLLFNVASWIKLKINAAALTFGSQIHSEPLGVIHQEKWLTESQLQEDATGRQRLPPWEQLSSLVAWNLITSRQFIYCALIKQRSFLAHWAHLLTVWFK